MYVHRYSDDGRLEPLTLSISLENSGTIPCTVRLAADSPAVFADGSSSLYVPLEGPVSCKLLVPVAG
jgi:hypothetical protein